MQFTPCRGGESCTQDGSHCQGCGRSHEEIAQTRQLIQGLARYAVEMGYDNLEEFTTFFGDKAAKVGRKLQADAAGGIAIPIK
ncbi:MAG: DUF1289 domain-containing protein [gamma proteobacterium symbiont of Phacoides pectinatus]